MTQTPFQNPPPDDPHAYAIACCQNGLIEKLPELSFAPETVAEAFIATLLAQPKNTHAILTYLWENHPDVSWGAQPILSRVITAAPQLAPNIFAHVFETDPQRMRLFARNVTVQALHEKNPELAKTVLPYLSEKTMGDLIKAACESKQMPFAKMLVRLYPVEGSLAFFKKLSPKHRQEVQEVLNEMQSRRIHSHLEISTSRPTSATRKM